MGSNETPEQVADSIKSYFRAINQNLDTWFHVAGYGSLEKRESLSEAWMVHVAGNTKQTAIGRGIQAAVWNGELDIMNRLMAIVEPQSVPAPQLRLGWITGGVLEETFLTSSQRCSNRGLKVT
jgi:hypothetical protein